MQNPGNAFFGFGSPVLVTVAAVYRCEALLVQGHDDRIRLLARDPAFLV